LEFIANDLEVQITTRANFGVGDDARATTVAARKLLDIVRALPESGDVRLSLDEAKLTVQAGRSRFALQTLAAAHSPTVTQSHQSVASSSIAQKALKNRFNLVHFAMALYYFRYSLIALLLVLEPCRAQCAATDGQRLAHGGVAD